jgi:hypothetical protein
MMAKSGFNKIFNKRVWVLFWVWVRVWVWAWRYEYIVLFLFLSFWAKTRRRQAPSLKQGSSRGKASQDRRKTCKRAWEANGQMCKWTKTVVRREKSQRNTPRISLSSCPETRCHPFLEFSRDLRSLPRAKVAIRHDRKGQDRQQWMNADMDQVCYWMRPTAFSIPAAHIRNTSTHHLFHVLYDAMPLTRFK